MSDKRSTFVPDVYVMHGCKTCGVTDLGHFKHEKNCKSLEARIERGERLSTGEVLARMEAAWRATNDDRVGADREPERNDVPEDETLKHEAMTVADAAGEMIRRAQDAGHQTVWSVAETMDGTRTLSFITWAPGVAERAEAALRAAGVLCDEPLGTLRGRLEG